MLFCGNNGSNMRRKRTALANCVLFGHFGHSIDLAGPKMTSRFHPSVVFHLTSFCLVCTRTTGRIGPGSTEILGCLGLIHRHTKLPSVRALGPTVHNGRRLRQTTVRHRHRVRLTARKRHCFSIEE